MTGQLAPTTEVQLWRALSAIVSERAAANAQHGDNVDLPDGTGLHPVPAQAYADGARFATEQATSAGQLTWRHVLMEEVAEAFAEADHVALRAELVQVAATAVRWVEAIDRRTTSR